MSKDMRARDTFHAPGWGHNCAQAVGFRWSGGDSEAIVREYAAYGGGRAPDGCCGALYAAMRACPENAAEIMARFEAEVGATRCRDIKSAGRVSCQRCVDVADRLVEEKFS